MAQATRHLPSQASQFGSLRVARKNLTNTENEVISKMQDPWLEFLDQPSNTVPSKVRSCQQY